MSHANARLTPMVRLLIIQRIEGGMAQAHVAAQMGLSRATVAKWWNRWQADGEAGLVDRSSRPRRSPRRTPAAVEDKIVGLRRRKRWGPARIAALLRALRDQAGTSGSDFCDGLSFAWFSSGCQKDAEAVVVEVAEASR